MYEYDKFYYFYLISTDSKDNERKHPVMLDMSFHSDIPQ